MKRFLLLLAVLLLTVGAAGAADPVAYYKLNGDFTDSAGTNHGTNSGTTFEPGYHNQSGYFDGSGYVDLGTTSYTDNFAISCWIYCTDASELQSIWSQNNNAFGIDSYAKQLIFQKTGTWETVRGDPIDEDEWVHVVLVKGGIGAGDTKLYQDGVLVSDNIAVPSITGGNAYIANQAGWDNFKGHIDELKIYDTTLNQSEITDLYTNSVHNSFVLSAYDELNQTQLNISSFTIYNENQSVSTGTLIDGDYYVYSTQFAELGQYITSIDSDNYYSRNFIVENGNTPSFVSTYLPPESEAVIYEQFTLNDNIALYEPSDIILRLDKPMGGSTNTVYSSYFDMNSQASTYLIPNDAYVLYIITPDETINYGWLYPDADGSVTIILNAFEFEETENWLDYTYECTDSAVSFDYESSKPIDEATFLISYANGTAVYNVNADTDTGSFTYNFPGNETYKIDISVEALDDDVFTMQKFIEIGKTNQKDFFPASFSLMLKSICVMFGIIIGVIGLSSYRSDLSAIWAFALYAFAVYQDWIFGNAITVSIMGIIALAAIKKFQKRESRM